MTVLILAGGFATRLWPLTEKTAKPLIPVGGKPLISYIVESLPINVRIIISTNAVFAEDFTRWKKEYFPRHAIEIFVEDATGEEQKKGALFATALAIEHKKIADDLLLIAGDNYFGFDIKKFIAEFNRQKTSCLVAAYNIGSIEKARAFGVIEADKKKKDEMISFLEKPDHPRSTLVSTGCFAFPKKLLSEIIHFAQQHRDDLGKIFEYFLNEKHSIRIFSFNGHWFDIGSFGAYLEANALLLKGKVMKEKNVAFSSDAKLHGSVFLGKNVRLGRSVILENSVVLADTFLENCTVRNSVIGSKSYISGVDLEHKIIRAESYLTDS